MPLSILMRMNAAAAETPPSKPPPIDDPPKTPPVEDPPPQRPPIEEPPEKPPAPPPGRDQPPPPVGDPPDRGKVQARAAAARGERDAATITDESRS